jgi:thioredoxin 1
MTKVFELDNKDEFKNLIKEGKVLVDFYAVWCGPCQMMKPVVEKYAEEKSDIKVVAVDVDKFAEIASNYNVMSIPTFVVFKDGEPLGSKNGAISESDLKSWVESY